MVFVPVSFDPALSVRVFAPFGAGTVSSTTGNDVTSYAYYPQLVSAIRLEYIAPQTPSIVALVLSLYTNQTGFIDFTQLTPAITGGPTVRPGPFTGMFNGITVTVTETNNGNWGQSSFGGSNPAGSLNLFTNEPVLEISFSVPVTGFRLQGWGAWSGGTDAIRLSAEVVTPPEEQVNGTAIPCDCCPSGPGRCINGTNELAFPCRRANGSIEWYDVDGQLVPSNSITTCPACPMTVTDLSINGRAFDYSGSFQEYLTLTPPAASMNVGTVLTAPNHYHVDGTTPPNPCGGFSIGVTLPPLSALDVSYGNPVNGVAIGDAFIQFRAPSLGGLLDFGVFAAASFPVGSTRVIPVAGGFARLTHVSNGPGSPPQGDPPLCGLTGNSLRMRNGNPIDLRLTFTTC